MFLSVCVSFRVCVWVMRCVFVCVSLLGCVYVLCVCVSLLGRVVVFVRGPSCNLLNVKPLINAASCLRGRDVFSGWTGSGEIYSGE